MADDERKGPTEIEKAAAAGLALFAGQDDGAVEGDKDAAQKFKDEADAKIKSLEEEVATLTGKDNAKARKEKSKQVSEMKKTPEYIDAERVLKGLEPKNGNFIKSGGAKKEAPKAAEAAPVEQAAEEKDDKKKKDDKKPKKELAAGISPAERKEMEKLKEDIIAKKKELKETGMSGGQINKHEDIVAWVARMNELKEKENPGCLEKEKKDSKDKKGKKLSAEAEAQVAELEKEIEEYRVKLAGPEFGYSKKEINADPDMQEMQEKLKALKK